MFLAWRHGDFYGLAQRKQAAPDVFAASADRAGEAARHLRALSQIDDFHREIAHLPIWVNGRRPRWWHDIEVREFVTAAHRQMSTLEAERQAAELYGDRAPRKSSIGLYWLRLDKAKRMLASDGVATVRALPKGSRT